MAMLTGSFIITMSRRDGGASFDFYGTSGHSSPHKILTKIRQELLFKNVSRSCLHSVGSAVYRGSDRLQQRRTR